MLLQIRHPWTKKKGTRPRLHPTHPDSEGDPSNQETGKLYCHRGRTAIGEPLLSSEVARGSKRGLSGPTMHAKSHADCCAVQDRETRRCRRATDKLVAVCEVRDTWWPGYCGLYTGPIVPRMSNWFRSEAGVLSVSTCPASRRNT
ncbi:unnamed protein product [Pleuronectes platessa]|uniref:Uncharacterized protein n=1 Tax=Pleuronectes platessa TaxID=8262 RepID=A0A9N7US11_PLEPL|nr:unnamed protein product [Pleuronectes platessa]